MIKEIAIISIDTKDTVLFEQVYREIIHIIRRQPGYHQDTLMSVNENAGEYALLIDWSSVKAHQDFVDSEDFPEVADKWGRLQKEVVVRHCQFVESSING